MLPMFLLPFRALNMSVALLFMEGQKAIRNILICVLKMNKGLVDLKQHEGE